MLNVSGTGFPIGDTVGTELWIDGSKQETVSVTATNAVFKLIDAMSSITSDIKFYTAEGLPQGSL